MPESEMVHITDWRRFFTDGGKYLQTAVRGGQNRPTIFLPEIVYNLTLMAIEKLIMGFLMYHGDLAENHTMIDLAAALERHLGPQPELTKKLTFLNSFQEICDFDTYCRRTLSQADMVETLAIGEEVRQFLTAQMAASCLGGAASSHI